MSRRLNNLRPPRALHCRPSSHESRALLTVQIPLKKPVQIEPAQAQDSGDAPQVLPRQLNVVVDVGPRLVTKATQISPVPQSPSVAQFDPVVTTLVHRPFTHSAANAWLVVPAIDCWFSAKSAWAQPRTRHPGTQDSKACCAAVNVASVPARIAVITLPQQSKWGSSTQSAAVVQLFTSALEKLAGHEPASVVLVASVPLEASAPLAPPLAAAAPAAPPLALASTAELVPPAPCDPPAPEDPAALEAPPAPAPATPAPPAALAPPEPVCSPIGTFFETQASARAPANVQAQLRKRRIDFK
jgi:hypothetical protein